MPIICHLQSYIPDIPISTNIMEIKDALGSVFEGGSENIYWTL